MSKVKSYKTLPVVIEAVQLVKENVPFLVDWADLEVIELNEGESYQYLVRTLEGVMEAKLNDFIIKGLRGEFYPCKPDVFKKKYSKIKDEKCS